MMYLLVGENWYGRDKALAALLAKSGAQPESIDTEKLSAENLNEILSAQTLFSERRCIVMKHLSENKTTWDALGELAGDISEDTTLILVEDKPDKRTKTYKTLQKLATVKEFPVWSERDSGLAVEWLLVEAKQRGVSLSTRDARMVVQRAGADQGRLAAALDKLALMPEVTQEAIEASIEARSSDNVFVLLDTALRGDSREVGAMIANLRQSEDAYRVFGLLTSQLMQLAALVHAEAPANEVARDIGAPPFVLSKLAPFAARLSNNDMRLLLEWAAETDMQMKSVAIDPWILVEKLLLNIAAR